MKAKARIILSTTLTLPLLAPTIAESTAGNESVSDTFQASDIPAPVHSTASVLTDKELDAVTGGRPEVVGGPWESPPGGRPRNYRPARQTLRLSVAKLR
jgi:bacteriocin-like protein